MKALSILGLTAAALIAALTVFSPSTVYAGVYIYSKLQMKNYDQMQKAVNARVQLAEKVGDSDQARAKSILEDALRLILSRPDSDDMVSELLPTVREPLRNLGVYEHEMSDVVDDAIITLNDKHAKSAVRATSLIILKNVMSQLRPDLASNNKKVKKIFEHIRDAKIKIPSAVKSDMFLRSTMKPGPSPSEIATKILKSKSYRPSDN